MMTRTFKKVIDEIPKLHWIYQPPGRGKNTHAYTHSVHEDHHVFLNLHTLKSYCLPDNYEIIDATLEDIKYVLNPIFTKDEVGC